MPRRINHFFPFLPLVAFLPSSALGLSASFSLAPASFSAAAPPASLASSSASSALVKNRPPAPRTLRWAWLCLDSWRYGLRDLIKRFSCSALALAARRRRMPWYCLALTYTGSSSISDGSIILALCNPPIMCGATIVACCW